MTISLGLQLLGDTNFIVDGAAVPIESRMQQQLLALVATQAQPMLRHDVALALWPESDAAAGQRNLRNLLWLTGKLAPVLSADNETVGLAKAVEWCDAVAVREWYPAVDAEESAESLHSLYTGDLLPIISNLPAYHWLSRRRAQIKNSFLDHVYNTGHRAASGSKWPVAHRLAKLGLGYEPKNARLQALLFAAAHNIAAQEDVWALLQNAAQLPTIVMRVARAAATQAQVSADVLPSPTANSTASITAPAVLTAMNKTMPDELPLDLTLLGAFSAQRSEPLSIKSPKQIALLGYLALNTLPATRDQLAMLLWPSSKVGSKNLRNMLWKLRQTVASEIFTIDNLSLSLLEGTLSDVRRFEKSAHDVQRYQRDDQGGQVLQLYGGALLRDWRLPNMTSFEHWLLIERQRIEHLAIGSLEMLLQIAVTKGAWDTVQQLADKLLSIDNYSESAYRASMLGSAQTGSPDRALRLFDQLCDLFTRDLAAIPEMMTLRLYEQIRDREQIEIGDYWQSLAVTMRPARAQTDKVPMLLERNDVMTLLAQSGNPQYLMIEGAFGQGKSSLLYALAERQSAAVLVTAAQQRFAEPLQLLTDTVRQLRPQLIDLDPQWQAYLSLWLPEFPAHETLALHLHSYEPFVQALHHAASKAPFIWLLDDVDAADADTPQVLAYVVQRLKALQSPISVIATRSAALVNSAELDTLMQSITLEPLSSASVQVMVRQLPQEQRVADPVIFGMTLYHMGAGNPFFTQQLLRHDVTTDDKLTLDTLFADWKERLSVEAQQWLLATAVLGEAATVGRVQQLLGIGEMDGLPIQEEAMSIDQLTASDVTVPLQQRHYHFKHQRIRQLFLEHADPAERRQFGRLAYSMAYNAQRSPQLLAEFALYADLHKQAFEQLLLAAKDAANKQAKTVSQQLLNEAKQIAEMPEAVEWISAEQESELRALSS